MFLAMEDGTHMANPNLEVLYATAYRLEPLTDDGIMSLDGEVVPYGPIQAAVVPGYARVLALTM